MTGAEMRQRFALARVARLASVDAAGRPHLVPLCFTLEDERLYSAVDQKPKRTPQLRRLRNVAAHPQVSLLADAYDEDWDRLWWVRADGQARVLESGEERERALELLAAKYPQYRAQPPLGPVLVVEVERWSG
ncbi:MAG TPA: TIGR03668 family PPOX class F420-dependent oxidoreductase, partial [Candidatus Acidoferrales bacterium]|nr:TIGR03668 family PPOX class F420-dependent oxidoreductase [Candidatus Acidoferrales bacterium]